MIETPKRVIHIARVHARVLGRDAVRFAPKGFAVDQPRTLVGRQVVGVRCSARHGQMMPRISGAKQ